MPDQFRSLVSREREFESRVHSELTPKSRERLASITNIHSRWSSKAFQELADEIGFSEIKEVSSNQNHTEFVLEADSVLALSYIEYYVRTAWNQVTSIGYHGRPDKNDVNEVIAKIEDVLITEGLLWDIEGDSDGIRFQPLESEAMEDVDEKVQALAEKEPWGDALKGYNDAFERYLEGDFDELIPKKLYNSIEEVLETICVDLEGWTSDREMSHAEYLRLLNKNDVYSANGITAPELDSLLDSLEKMVSKIGHDRKQRHAYHDRAYCTLLIHQVGAYLYFLIGRYDEYKS